MTKQRGDLPKRKRAQRIEGRARSSNRGHVAATPAWAHELTKQMLPAKLPTHVWLLLFERDGELWVVAGFRTRREAEREARLNRKRALSPMTTRIPLQYLGTSQHFGRVFVRKAVLA